MLKGTVLLDKAKSALLNGKLLHLSYDGFERDVEVHAIGTSKTNNLVMRVYQVRGDAISGNLGWKLLKLDEIKNLSILDEESEAPRPGYAMDDRGMIEVISQLDSK